MTNEQQIQQLESEIKYLESCNRISAAGITRAEERITKLKQQIAALKERRFYIGERFITTTGVMYVLTAVYNKIPRLISPADGIDKADGLEFDIPIMVEPDTRRQYITQLPTVFPGDFNLPHTCGGRRIHA